MLHLIVGPNVSATKLGLLLKITYQEGDQRVMHGITQITARSLKSPKHTPVPPAICAQTVFVVAKHGIEPAGPSRRE